MNKILLICILTCSLIVLAACGLPIDKERLLLDFSNDFIIDNNLDDGKLDIPNQVYIDGLGDVQIAFTSSNEAVITLDGLIHKIHSDVVVTITVIFTIDTLIETKEFQVTVAKIDDPLTTYDVTFNPDNGDLTIIFTVTHNNKVTKPSDPYKAGYEFIGWFNGDIPYNFDDLVASPISLIAKYQIIEEDIYFDVIFDSNGGSSVLPLSIIKDGLITTVPTTDKVGFIFVGWFLGEVLFDFDQMITSDMTLEARWIDETLNSNDLITGAYNESIYATWDDYSPNLAKVYVKQTDLNEWLKVDQMLIRSIDNGQSRVDVVGLKSGTYDIKVVSSLNEVLIKTNIFTKSHDRSGYAHFNYEEGIGAYTDEGVLKSDAVVIYVTEENKNTITIPGLSQVGLGWILNNNQYSSGSSNTKDPVKALNSLSGFNRPIVFRLIGKITAPEGLTAYNSTIQGGSIGDNGNMARIKDAKNITIEGIGEDASIYGWGIHFIASTVGRGTGFEVRNLTFKHYSEDAIGLEGVQSGTTLTVPVSRGWMHHLTFYEGYHPNPAESDKANGDGSLDIKRGEYFTVSYSQFLGAHKTNLVGSSDTSLQYHITYHHNHWKNNASRIPLARQANIHMYNNFFETTDDNLNENSYAQNTRANAYIFSEANYFFGTKNPSRVDGGAIKSWNDVKYSTYDADGATKVTSRISAVASGNKFENFDTNKDVFYYDEVNFKSNVSHLTDAITARKEVLMYAGTYRISDDLSLVKITDQIPQEVTESIESGVVKINKGIPLIVFHVPVVATVTIQSGTSSIPPVLVTIYGEEILVGSGTVDIIPGTYVIESRQAHGASKGVSQAKESTAGYQIVLDSQEASEARVNLYLSKLSNLPEIVMYDLSYQALLSEVRQLYNALTEVEKTTVSDVVLVEKELEFVSLGIEYIESRIEEIGVVDETSYSKIAEAKDAYEKALNEIKLGITNYQVLVDAILTYETLKINHLETRIDELIDTSLIGINERNEIKEHLDFYLEVYEMYNLLNISKQAQVSNAAKLVMGLETLENMYLPHEINDFINELILDEITRQNSSLLVSYHAAFNTLNDTQKTVISIENQAKLEEAMDIYESIQGTVYQFIPETNTNTSNYFTYVGDSYVSNAGTFLIRTIEMTLSAKLNSSATITFTTTSPNSTLWIAVKIRTLGTDGRLNIDGTIYHLDPIYDETGMAYIEVTLLDAKTYVIKRDNKELVVYYIEVVE